MAQGSTRTTTAQYKAGVLISLQGPEITQMYSLGMPVAKLRAKMREEFEKHRFVNNLQAVDVLIMQSHMEYQVRQKLCDNGREEHGS